MDGIIALIFVIVVLIAVFLIMNGQTKATDALNAQKKKALTDAHNAYQGALGELKANQTSADTKQRALELGRAYASLTRAQSTVTVFDEMALSNDINAATAGAAQADSPVSVETRLQQLEGLRTRGLISAAEYDEKRKRLIAEM